MIRALSESRKAVVGHNMLLDLCFTLNQFVEPLPEEYADFKALVKEVRQKHITVLRTSQYLVCSSEASMLLPSLLPHLSVFLQTVTNS